jgi:hypothetical protein
MDELNSNQKIYAFVIPFAPEETMKTRQDRELPGISDFRFVIAGFGVCWINHSSLGSLIPPLLP